MYETIKPAKICETLKYLQQTLLCIFNKYLHKKILYIINKMNIDDEFKKKYNRNFNTELEFIVYVIMISMIATIAAIKKFVRRRKIRH